MRVDGYVNGGGGKEMSNSCERGSENRERRETDVGCQRV